MIYVRKMYKKNFECQKTIKVERKNLNNVLLKFHFSLTSFKDLNFPSLEAKFPDFSLTFVKCFPLTIS